MRDLFQYVPGTSLLHRLNPVTKLLLTVVICVAAFITDRLIFLLGLLALQCSDTLSKRPLHASTAVLALCLCSMAANVSYGWLSIALCLGMRQAGKNRLHLMLYTAGTLLLYTFSLLFSGVAKSWVLVSLCALFAVIPLLLYNGRRGMRRPLLTFLFYAAYPLHMIALLVIRAMRIVPPYFF